MKIESKNNEYTTVDFESWNALHYIVSFCPIAVVAIAMVAAYIML